VRFGKTKLYFETTAHLSGLKARRLFKSVQKFEAAWQSGQFPKGLSMTHLRGGIFEFRIDIHCRILFQRSGDCILYLLYGSHDNIRRFLKNL
jgi:putative component of toxin-antitoxin plasmid stabilization module